MRLYRILRGMHECSVLAVFWLYVVLFVLAFASIFVFPPVALLIFFAALALLPLLLLSCRIVRWSRHASARGVMGGGRCPACGQRIPGDPGLAVRWRCESCDTCFLPGGVEEPRQMVQSHA
ncbi:MAG: hypothetical protein KF817_06645 [Phycisphaeraceae bacterium]|nr:hypothetical protein [Phycisphaeraceae bacterium]